MAKKLFGSLDSDFKAPPRHWCLLACVGGIVTGGFAIWGLELWGQKLTEKKVATRDSRPTVVNVALTPTAKLDLASIVASDRVATAADFQVTTPYAPPQGGSLSAQEVEMAGAAWQYFKNNWQAKTGFVNSVNNFESVTIWDQAAAMAAVVSAKELGIISDSEFQQKMNLMLDTLAALPLYRGELPNKVYNSKTLLPVDYGKLTERQEIGWSAIDLGRLAIWLKIVDYRYPIFQVKTEKVWRSWRVDRLVKDGKMYGTNVVNGRESYNQEGRFGYENYAAYGLSLWGLNVRKAANNREHIGFVNIYSEAIAYDRRDLRNSGANNYVLSEPYILDGIETGFQSLPKVYADHLLAAQAARYRATSRLTAVTEDNIDRPPYFLYNTAFVNGQAWGTITDTGENRDNLRFLSAKAAVGWHVLYGNDYTKKLFNATAINLQASGGFYSGLYEVNNLPNRVQTANNNGIILESLLYKKVGLPLIVWAKNK
jgi:hypothetical protein